MKKVPRTLTPEYKETIINTCHILQRLDKCPACIDYDKGEYEPSYCEDCVLNINDIINENTLPVTVTVNIDDLDYCPEDGDILDNALSDWLSDEYGYCHNGFEYSTDAITGDITIDNIDWDIDEEDD